MASRWVTVRLEASVPEPYRQNVSFWNKGSASRRVAHFAAQILDLAGCGLAFGVARQSLLAGFQELLRPLVVEALGNAFTPAQLCNGVFASKPFQDYADLVFGRVLLAGLAADLTDVFFGRRLRPGFRSNLRSLRATMISHLRRGILS